jgi:hypothetical protein
VANRLFEKGLFGIEIAGPLVEFFLSAPGNIQEQLLAREVGSPLASRLLQLLLLLLLL